MDLLEHGWRLLLDVVLGFSWPALDMVAGWRAERRRPLDLVSRSDGVPARGWWSARQIWWPALILMSGPHQVMDEARDHLER